MATDLPVIQFRKHAYGDQNVRSAVTASSHDESLPNVTASNSKRNSDGQVLQVKFDPDVKIADFSGTVSTSKELVQTGHGVPRIKGLVQGIDPMLHVDHNHYEQWARIKGRRAPNSSLLRGIQALKARMKRDGIEQERLESGQGQARELHINTLNRNSLLTRDKLIDDAAKVKREKSITHLPRSQIEPRSPLKTNAHVIDSDVFKDLNLDLEKCADDKYDRMPQREILKPRYGMARIRDRCALPVSVYQPISIGDHVFLINEPINYSEYIRIKSKTDVRMKKDSRSSQERPRYSEEPNQDGSYQMEVNIDPVERANTFTSGAHITKGKRVPVVVSSAELFDFSQLSDIQNSIETKYFERSRTDISLNGRSGRSVKLVPNVRRLKGGSLKTSA
ncbi:uncharacterized protein LOC128232657 [Mya arenaria]|uniref:uncharacterized protein LOC128232657 n=1 Tax=Mya arenaria TaxID=6604 RepID=UPI0022E45191|nr:uncharacterized protein LOC128232657 [Mya arenaria]XP_052802306.1 uncharacterized protein LOC128232657 [Mya arenaria]XP_052802307.1 uncharacterized protein LOC128232657 [Mya arenaria]XP_052802308.1 uncharacterized protein LOC128232657 [Mya arenaria]